MTKELFGRPRRVSIDRPGAEALAVSALAFLGAEPERLARFLEATGLLPQTLRKAAGDPAFLGGLLDFVAGDESLLLDLAREVGETPERIMAARHVLSPVADDF